MKTKFNDTFYVPVREDENGTQFLFDSHGKVRNYISEDAVKKNVPAYQYYNYIYEYKISRRIKVVKNENN